MNPSAFALHEVVLQKLKVAAQQVVSPSVAASVDAAILQDHLTGQLIYQLKAYVLAEHLDAHTQRCSETVSFEVPASWWDHWKADHRALIEARWFRLLFWRFAPARTTTLQRVVRLEARWDRYAAFPEATIVDDRRLGAPVRWLQADVTTWQGDPREAELRDHYRGEG